MTQFITDLGIYPPTCLPVDVDQTELVEATTHGDSWRTFVSIRTGETHDCSEYYTQMMREYEISNNTIETENRG